MKTRFRGHTAPICRITLSKDYIHSTSNDKTLRVWSKESGECLRILESFRYIPYHSADDRSVYVIAWADLFVFDVRNWAKIAQIRLDSSQDLQGLAQDADRLYIPSRDGKLFIIDKEKFAAGQGSEQGSQQAYKPDQGLVDTLETGGSTWAIACGARHLYLSSLEGSIVVWDKASLRPVQTLTGHKKNVQRLAVDDRYLYSLSADRDLIVWDQSDGALVKRLPKVFKRSMIGLRPDYSRVYLANAEEGLKVLEKETWELVGARPDLRVPYGKGMAVDDGDLYLGLVDCSIGVFSKGELLNAPLDPVHR